MIRFIIRRRIKDQWNNGLEEEFFETFDAECEILETALSQGGRSEGHYDLRELAGVELLPSPPTELED